MEATVNVRFVRDFDFFPGDQTTVTYYARPDVVEVSRTVADLAIAAGAAEPVTEEPEHDPDAVSGKAAIEPEV